jgi:hypothetical protein
MTCTDTSNPTPKPFVAGGGSTIALDNGDTFHGTFVAGQSRGEGMAGVPNACDQHKAEGARLAELAKELAEKLPAFKPAPSGVRRSAHASADPV